MGVVYQARDESLGRLVAIKVLPGGRSDLHSARARFHREARAASALNHPNIITIHEITSADDTEMIVMEYVSGRTLAQVIGGGPLPFDRVFALGLQIADALAQAHAARVIHRDLKPGNVMVTDDGLVKVLDFGLAKIHDGPVTSDDETRLGMEGLTAAHTVMGTTSYMSPEQATGQSLDARTDVFSFGVVLYEMISGRLPFKGKTSVEVLGNLLGHAPTPIAELRPDTPPALREILARALAKSLDDRFSSMAEVRDALRAAHRGAEGLAYPSRSDDDAPTTLQTLAESPDTGADSPRWRRWIPAALILVALSAGGVAAWPFLTRMMTSSSEGTVLMTGPDSTAFEHYQAGRALLDRHDRRGNLDKSIAEFEQAISKDANHAPAYAGLADAYYQKNAANPDPQLLRQARDAADKAVALNPDLSIARIALGKVLTSEGDLERAETELTLAVTMNPQSADAHMWLGALYRSRKDAVRAEAHFRQAVALAPADAWLPLAVLGEFLYRAAQYDEAATVWERSAQLVPDNATIHRQLGAAYHMLDRIDDAANQFQLALAIEPTAPVYNNLGTLRFFQGKYSEAVPAFEKAVEMRANAYLYWGNLGDAYRWSPGMRDRAADAYRNAVQLAREVLRTKPDVEVQSRIALYLAKAGDATGALREIAEVEKSDTRSAASLFRALVVYELAGDRSRALSTLKQALDAGYSALEIRTEPELVGLRTDRKFHDIISAPKDPGN